jgi:hypothetical protein
MIAQADPGQIRTILQLLGVSGLEIAGLVLLILRRKVGGSASERWFLKMYGLPLEQERLGRATLV